MSVPLPKISVVIPSFNQAAYVRQCLESVFLQHYPNLEVIVLDGGSTDGSLAILREYQDRCHYFESKPDGGQIAALNRGLFSIATGEILTWLNTDDYWPPGVLAEVARAISPREGRWLVAGRSRWVHEPGAREADHPFFGSRIHRQLARFWRHGTVPQCSVFFHRRIMEQTGWLNAGEPLGFDYEYWLRLTAQPGVQMFFVDRVWSYYRLQDHAKTVLAHEQSHRDLERISRRFWPRWFRPARWVWELDYWLSTDPNKPQQQRFLKQVGPALHTARQQRQWGRYLLALAWIATRTPVNLFAGKIRRRDRLPSFPVLALFCRRKRFRRRLAASVQRQGGRYLHAVSDRAFNLHPGSLAEPPTRLVIETPLFARPRIVIWFQADLPDARAAGVNLSCWLENTAGQRVGQRSWTIRPGPGLSCSAEWNGAASGARRLVLETSLADGAASNFYCSTIITDLRATVI
jgi:glycosyltransferase involved in cell wall biosynthesis